jgi:hypothetical protein
MVSESCPRYTGLMLHLQAENGRSALVLPVLSCPLHTTNRVMIVSHFMW